MNALVGAFNQEKALATVGAFSVIVKSPQTFALPCLRFKLYLGSPVVRVVQHHVVHVAELVRQLTLPVPHHHSGDAHLSSVQDSTCNKR